VPPPLVLLPGLHGTAALFKRFIAAAPRHVTTTAVPLPHESLSYPELAGRIAADLPTESSVIVAESFSGPLAVALTPLCRVEALILCNTFVTAPALRALRWLVNPMMFRRPMPEYLLRRYLLDQSVDVALVREVAAAIASVPAELLASRLRVLLEANEADTFAHCVVPTLYLRGTDDRIVRDSAWRRMAALRPMTTVRLPGPHLLLQANPAAAWKAIMPFLEESCL
jgi:pimeloyl-[acyl-carrier protein] methyl ester esterase